MAEVSQAEINAVAHLEPRLDRKTVYAITFILDIYKREQAAKWVDQREARRIANIIIQQLQNGSAEFRKAADDAEQNIDATIDLISCFQNH